MVGEDKWGRWVCGVCVGGGGSWVWALGKRACGVTAGVPHLAMDRAHLCCIRSGTLLP